jgi:hypothetical protein
MSRPIQLTFEDVFPDAWLPRRPRAGDVKNGQAWTARMSRERALTLPHIEANPPALRSLVIVDHDCGDARRIAERVGLPDPSWISENLWTGDGAIGYGLRDPVCVTDAARRKPMNLLARIEAGLVDALEGDPAYTGYMTKNPTHDMHATTWGTGRLYTLADLAAPLARLGKLPAAGHPKRNLSASALGRNCAGFDDGRHWAYRAIRRYWGGPAGVWDDAVAEYLHRLNAGTITEVFAAGPLPLREVEGIAHSISRWTWRNTTPDGFRETQATRGALRGAQEIKQAAERAQTIWEALQW